VRVCARAVGILYLRIVNFGWMGFDALWPPGRRWARIGVVRTGRQTVKWLSSEMVKWELGGMFAVRAGVGGAVGYGM